MKVKLIKWREQRIWHVITIFSRLFVNFTKTLPLFKISNFFVKFSTFLILFSNFFLFSLSKFLIFSHENIFYGISNFKSLCISWLIYLLIELIFYPSCLLYKKKLCILCDLKNDLKQIIWASTKMLQKDIFSSSTVIVVIFYKSPIKWITNPTCFENEPY